ncbi:MAG TPA: peptidoglycan DD-metalloendopeptidase family protein [Aggregatilineales bacterium]|nr:peptidoglycan DD-metalloendopeptidase family protein [Anaerolineales bacterium]HRE48182.1 peptidoglycan DD-metalloendopeptidase family protein [Aggregatilineales bacterium]
MPTPYDGKVALWYVHGRTVGENTLDELIDTIRTYAPAVDALFVKIGEGSQWIGNLGAGDPKPDLAIRSLADIDRWVSKLAAVGLDFHAWAIPYGKNPTAEADFLIQACKRPGVKSLILDVEPFEGYFSGGRAAIRPFMLRLKSGVPADFHIGMSVDPRPWHYDPIFPDEWRPFLNSVHPQIYWAEFGLTPDSGFQQAYGRWGSYGIPLIPVLQGFQGRGDKITADGMDRARVIALETYKTPGLSWFRFGTLNKALFPPVNVNIDGSVPGGDQGTPVGVGRYGAEVVVKPNDGGYREGTYDGAPSPLRSFTNEEGWTSRYFTSSPFSSRVWVRYEPRLPASGFYEISAFIPSQHGTTNNARYKINGIVGQPGDLEVAIPQTKLDSAWASLGVYQFDITKPNTGIVFLNDLTGEAGREVVFDAIRWRQVIGWQRPPRYVADGFDAPVGLDPERNAIYSGTPYPPTWLLTLGYAVRYALLGRESLHTGDDLVSKRGKTKGQQIYAVASGEVVYAQRAGKAPNWGSWGNVVIIRHDPQITTGKIVYSRYGHVENMQVKAGDRVSRGQHIADIGDAFGVFQNAPHLHYDISPTRIFETAPGDWPWLDAGRIQRDYLNPKGFITANRPPKP